MAENYEDAWFCGYVPQLAACVWIGYPHRERPLPDVEGVPEVFGGSLPRRDRHAFIAEAVGNLEVPDFAAEFLSPRPVSRAARDDRKTLKTQGETADRRSVQFAQVARTASLALVAAVGAAATALLTSSTGVASPLGGSPTVKVVERDFSIRAPQRIAAGDVRLVVRNAGPNTHELLIVRATRGSLPLRSDSLTVNEEAVQHRLAGVVEGFGPGNVATLSVHLAPGRYVLLCNMAGHYLGGMHRRLVVR
jgi:uncharacterized cupredoxin-like copper-binding protein